MVDRENREDWKRERSLLALGQAVRGEDDSEASLVSIGDRTNSSRREDAATRHRLARSRREARANPTPSAAAGAERFQLGEQPAATAQAHAWRSQEEVDTGDLPAAASRARTTQVEPSGSGRPDDAPGSRYADDADAPVGDGADSQQWKPLIDPMQVVRGVARSKLLIITTTILGAGLGVALAT